MPALRLQYEGTWHRGPGVPARPRAHALARWLAARIAREGRGDGDSDARVAGDAREHREGVSGLMISFDCGWGRL